MNALKGQARWLTWPSTWSALIGVSLALLYAVFTVEIRPGTRGWFGAIVVFIVVVFNVIGDREEQVRLKTLKGVGDGTVPAGRENLILALQEASRLPR